jgi:hypothetical protein
MHFVNAEWVRIRVRGRALEEPVLVAPDMLGFRGDDARRARRHFGCERHRVGLEPEVPVDGDDLVLVTRPGSDVRNEELPDPA